MENKILTRALNFLGLERRNLTIAPTTGLGLPYGVPSSPLSITAALQLSVVYRCVEAITDAIGSQTWEYLNYNDKDGWVSDPFNDVAYMLNNEPHVSMSRFTMMKTLYAKVLLEGDGYLIINRKYDMGDPISLQLVNGSVKVFQRLDGSIYYLVTPYIGTTQGSEFQVEDENMIHILNYSYDGLVGVSTLTHATNSLGLAQASEASAKGFFKSGANMSGILQQEVGKLTPEKAQGIKESWAKAFDITSGQPGGIAVMEGGLKFTPVTVNPKDAQMLETRQFNVVDLCRFFGCSPSKAFDSQNLTYSNIESFQLGFLTDTISAIDTKIECEFNRKLLRPSKRKKTKFNLNIDDLLRANMDATSNYMSKMFQCGGYTINEIRVKNGMPKVEGGDKAYYPMNLIASDTKVTQNKQVDKNLNIKE
jgi:HK97 family phage portal protein